MSSSESHLVKSNSRTGILQQWPSGHIKGSISTSANFRVWPISTSANFSMLNFGTNRGWGPKGWRPKPGKSGPQKGGRPKTSRFFSLLPPQLFFFFLSLGVSWNFGGVLKRRGPQICTFGVLGLSCASPGGPVWWGRRGFTRQPESPNVHKPATPS